MVLRMVLTLTDCFIVGSLLSLFVLFRRRTAASRARNPRERPYPPGPPGHPLLTNVLDWPQGNSWLRFSEWKKQYGDIVHLNLLGKHVVVLNSYETAKDVLEQSKYSDRPHFTMAGELMGFLPSIILSPYDAHWKFMRKLTHQAISKTAVSTYDSYHEADARRLVNLLLENPANWRSAVRFILGRNILKTTYGLEVHSPENELITVSEATHHDLSLALVPGAFLVDVLPALKHVPAWFPGAGFQQHAARSRKRAWKMAEETYLQVKNAYDLGNAPPSYVVSILDQEESMNHDPSNWENAVKWSAASLYGASTESSFATLSAFFLAMAMNPDVRRKAQAELDAVVGRNRLPTFGDRDELPYVEAILKETIRWHPPNPIGIAHGAMEDGYYQDYFIPAGSIMIFNEWDISQDASIYKDPAVFRPERFLKEKPELSSLEWGFGFGRRNCPGMYYATAVLYIVMASVLSTFDIEAVDNEGKPIQIEAKFSDSFISYAEEFPCRITPRNRIDTAIL
ncbi:hypothetical protein FOMPIDRAFT_1053918 [Fomitopsis schrenkii]|uniref:Cytochrome P450 n=1 Tax=Fomitopsis schrenkii TaxID=2126942 RepID=S8DR64_FOMSC|nr:hypothetical protein FOMPIDRAFT_1053918 [Fomitopsis schrenkii]